MSLTNTDINTNTCKCHLAIDNINIYCDNTISISIYCYWLTLLLSPGLKTLKRCLPLWSWRPTRWRTTRQPSGRNGWRPPRWCGSRPRTQKNPPQMTNWGLSVSATLTAWRHTCPRGFRTETFLYTPGTLHGVAISQRYPFPLTVCSALSTLGCITAYQ